MNKKSVSVLDGAPTRRRTYSPDTPGHAEHQSCEGDLQ